MIQRVLNHWGIHVPWARQSVRGYVDVLVPAEPDQANFTSWLYCPESLQDEPAEQWGEIIRARFTSPEGQFVLRPAWNETPNAYVRIPETFWLYLRPGDWVEGRVKSNRDADKWCLGDLTVVAAVNGGDLPKSDRANWLLQPLADRLPIGRSPFHGKLATLLKVTHCLPGLGDGAGVISPAQAGKSTFLRDLLAELKQGVKVVVISSERPEEIADFQAFSPEGVEFFIALEGSSPLRRLHNLELGLHRAMRLAELGLDIDDVVVILDSATKALWDPINQLPPPKGVGIESGAVSPLAREVATAVVNVRGRYRVGSITLIASILNEGDLGSLALRSKWRRSGTIEITLSSELALAGIFPALEFALEEVQGKGETVLWRQTNARRMQDWASEELHRAALRLQTKLMKQTHLKAIREDEFAKRQRDKKHPPMPHGLDEQRAQKRANEALRKLIKLALWQGADEERIFREFGISYAPELVKEEPEEARAFRSEPRRRMSDAEVLDRAQSFFGFAPQNP